MNIFVYTSMHEQQELKAQGKLPVYTHSTYAHTYTYIYMHIYIYTYGYIYIYMYVNT